MWDHFTQRHQPAQATDVARHVRVLEHDVGQPHAGTEATNVARHGHILCVMYATKGTFKKTPDVPLEKVLGRLPHFLAYTRG